jgi:hypothetical protein
MLDQNEKSPLINADFFRVLENSILSTFGVDKHERLCYNDLCTRKIK